MGSGAQLWGRGEVDAPGSRLRRQVTAVGKRCLGFSLWLLLLFVKLSPNQTSQKATGTARFAANRLMKAPAYADIENKRGKQAAQGESGLSKSYMVVQPGQTESQVGALRLITIGASSYVEQLEALDDDIKNM